MQVLRVLRALRLMRLAKLLSASRLLQHWETQLVISYGAIMLFKARGLPSPPRPRPPVPARAPIRPLLPPTGPRHRPPRRLCSSSQVVVQMLVYCHWFACIWSLQTQFGYFIAEVPFARSWLVDDGYCAPLADIRAERSFVIREPVDGMQSCAAAWPIASVGSSAIQRACLAPWPQVLSCHRRLERAIRRVA
jgi:hypothetical protein